MTHDELLMRLWDKRNSLCNNLDIHFALSTIVELHKPIKDEWFNVGETICKECTREEYTTKYPCDTIQAIEKELQ